MQAGKELGFWMCTALVVGNTIGIGIYVLPASLAPYGFNAMIGWGITVVGMTVLARVFARLAREFPAADGPYAYIEATGGRVAAFISIWCYWISIWITNAAIAIGVVGYLGKVAPGLDAVPGSVQALALLWLFIGVNLLGVRTGGGVQVATTVLKLLPMAVIMLLGGWLLLTEPSTYVAHPPATPVSLEGLMAASTIALFAMLGIESAAVPAGRVRDPERTIPRSMIDASSSGSMLPPDSTRPIRRPRKRSGWRSSAASPAAPAPSTTVFSISSSISTACSTSPSSTSTMPSTRWRMIGSVRSPSRSTAMPSAIEAAPTGWHPPSIAS